MENTLPRVMCEYREDMNTAFSFVFQNWEKILSHYCILVFVFFSM